MNLENAPDSILSPETHPLYLRFSHLRLGRRAGSRRGCHHGERDHCAFWWRQPSSCVVGSLPDYRTAVSVTWFSVGARVLPLAFRPSSLPIPLALFSELLTPASLPDAPSPSGRAVTGLALPAGPLTRLSQSHPFRVGTRDAPSSYAPLSRLSGGCYRSKPLAQSRFNSLQRAILNLLRHITNAQKVSKTWNRGQEQQENKQLCTYRQVKAENQSAACRIHSLRTFSLLPKSTTLFRPTSHDSPSSVFLVNQLRIPG